MRFLLLFSLVLSTGRAYGGASCRAFIGSIKQNDQLSFSTSSEKKLGDLLPAEIAEIQKRTDELNIDLFVVGSAARGKRRHIGSTLPIGGFGGSKAETRSDIDYAVKNGLDDIESLANLPSIDPAFGVRGVDSINLNKGPIILFSPKQRPLVIEGKGRLMLGD